MVGEMKLLTPLEVDGILRYPKGKSQRLARRGRLPHVTLPDGSIRFRDSDISKLIGAKDESPTGITASSRADKIEHVPPAGSGAQHHKNEGVDAGAAVDCGRALAI
jgi:hypothetical protein